MSKVEVLLPHGVRINTEPRSTYLRKARNSEGVLLPVPRAQRQVETIGQVVVEGVKVDLEYVTLGAVENLPDYNPNRPKVVSKATIAAAAREDRQVDDLYFPFETGRAADGSRIVPGLGYAAVRHHNPQSAMDKPAWIGQELVLTNACTYPVNLLQADMRTEKGTLLHIPTPSAKHQLQAQYRSVLDDARSVELGVPVYEVSYQEVAQPDYIPDTLQVVDFDTMLRMGGQAASEAGCVTLGREVRDTDGSVIGGRSLAIIETTSGFYI